MIPLEPQQNYKRENQTGAFFLIAVAILTVVDLYEDSLEGVEIQHVMTEALIILLAVWGALFFWRSSVRKLRSTNVSLLSQLANANKDLEQWRSKTAAIYRDLHAEMLKQFELWGLSDAEADVAMLLLKGMSHKEIADIRKTSEKTVRQQATALYQKSNLEGRAQLSAFFLMDLLPDGSTQPTS